MPTRRTIPIPVPNHLQSGSEAVDVASRVGASSRAGHGREPDVSGCLLARLAEKGGGGEVAPVAIAGEGAVGTGATGMDGTLRDAFMVDCGGLLV